MAYIEPITPAPCEWKELERCEKSATQKLRSRAGNIVGRYCTPHARQALRRLEAYENTPAKDR